MFPEYEPNVSIYYLIKLILTPLFTNCIFLKKKKIVYSFDFIRK